MFPGLELEIEDLLLLESFQIKYLPDRVPEKEFAILLHSNPLIAKFLVLKYPPVDDFIKKILSAYDPLSDKQEIMLYCQDLLWEIADMIIYNKYPEIYDKNAKIDWKVGEIIDPAFLKGKTVIDAGAGTGKIAFMVAAFAEVVFAIEPVTSLRGFIKEKSISAKLGNLYALDGFLDSMPLPDASADVLFTSNAIGWNLEKELHEIERVLRSGGKAVHLMFDPSGMSGNPLYDILCSSPWNYDFTDFDIKSGSKFKYSKTIV
jgi:SAM-dependent methyltransferase